MTLPIDAIVPIYYSACVNVASTNSQSLVVNSPPILPPKQSIISIISKHLDNVFRIQSGLTEVISIYENLLAHRQKTPISLTGSVSISDAPILRKVKPFLSEIISLIGLVSTGPRIGTGNYVQLNNSASFTNRLSVVAWVKFINADNRGYGGVISFINGYFGNRLLLNEDGQTILFETATLVTGAVDCSYTIPGSVFSNAWHHFAAVYDGSQLQLYLDGAPVGTPVAQSGTLISGSGKTSIGIGAAGVYYLHGNVAELALYNSALSASDISSVYNNGANTVTSGQVSYYKFNEGSGHAIHDSRGNIDGQIINDQLWSTDIHNPLPNPSIYQGYFAPETIRRGIVRSIVDSALSIADAIVRLVRPRIIPGATFISELLHAGPFVLISEFVHVAEGSGFTSGFTNGFVAPIVGLLIRVIPNIAAETITISESKIRKAIPKIVLETVTILQLLKYSRARTLTDIVTILDSKIRKALPKVATETTAISESKVRKPIPKIATETTSISQQFIRKAIPKITGTVAISEQLLRKAIPKIALETITILSALTEIYKYFRTAVGTVTILDSKVRKTIPNIVAQTVTISESRLRKAIPKITTETATISALLLGLKGRFISLTGTVTIGAEVLTKIAKHFRTGSDTATVSDSVLRKPIPKIIAQTITIVEATIKRGITHKLNETITILDLLLRKIKTALTGTVTLSELLTKVGIHKRPASDTVTISDSSLRRAMPKIVAQTITISESNIRKVIPKIITAGVSASELLAALGGKTKALVDTIHVLESLTRKAKYVRTASDTTTISESAKNKIIRTLAQSITISESRLRKAIISMAAQTVTISESRVRKVVPKISLQTITIQGVVINPINRIISILQTVTISESRIRKPIPKITTQTIAVSDLIKIPIYRRIVESISTTAQILRKIARQVSQTVTLSDNVSRLGQVSSTKTVIYTLYRDATKTSGAASGGGAMGELVHRPIPISSYITDYTMEYRRRWKGQY